MAERLGLQAEEKDLKARLDLAMSTKGMMYYQASDGTEIERKPGELKITARRKKDGDNPLDTSDDKTGTEGEFDTE